MAVKRGGFTLRTRQFSRVTARGVPPAAHPVQGVIPLSWPEQEPLYWLKGTPLVLSMGTHHPWKGHGTRDQGIPFPAESSWDQRPWGNSPAPLLTDRHMHNSYLPHPSDVRGNKRVKQDANLSGRLATRLLCVLFLVILTFVWLISIMVTRYPMYKWILQLWKVDSHSNMEINGRGVIESVTTYGLYP